MSISRSAPARSSASSGPNGSGKTTTILMLLGLTEPTGGRAEVAGFDPLREPLEVKRRVGYLPDQVGFYDGLSARDNLDLYRPPRRAAAREIDERFDAAMSGSGSPMSGGRGSARFRRACASASALPRS